MTHKHHQTEKTPRPQRAAPDSPDPTAEPDPVIVPITGELDLHTFHPGDVPLLLDDYFEACLEAGIDSVRVVHGKGTGTLKRRVHHLLARHPLVRDFKDAAAQAGGWGATVVTLKPAR